MGRLFKPNAKWVWCRPALPPDCAASSRRALSKRRELSGKHDGARLELSW